MASRAMSKILGNKARKSKPITNVGEIHVPPTAFHRGASQSGGDKIVLAQYFVDLPAFNIRSDNLGIE